MAVTAWRFPGTISSQNRAGGNVAWTNPLRALDSNDSWATAALAVNSTHWLWATNFGFTESDIPGGSTITGLEVRWERNQTTGLGVEGPTTAYFKLIVGGVEAGTQKTSNGHLPTTDGLETKGGDGDTWGYSGELSQTDCLASTTGFAVAFADLDYDSTTVSVDAVSIRWYYTAPVAVARPGLMMVNIG